MAKARNASPAAYTLVDMSALDEDTRKDIIEDAAAGGGQYGVRVVEEVINGGARAPIYGYYHDGPDADRWAQAKKDLGLSAAEGDDAEARAAATGATVDDPRREAALRQAAEEKARADAERQRLAEDGEVERITGTTHASNIVDDTLAEDAENEVNDVDSAEEQSTRPTRRNTRTPK